MGLEIMVALSLFCGSLDQTDAPPEGRTRLIVLSDISSLTPGVAEPDDGQSLIRLMLYADEFDIEGLVATSNMGHGQRTRPDLIRQVVDAYEKVRPNLARHDPRYPLGGSLLRCIKAGQSLAGPKLPVEDSVGAGKDTEGSDWIIQVADRADPRPVWVLIWGGSADLAQALWRVRTNRTPEEVERFLAKLRVHAIGDQDSTGPWIRAEFPGLYMITQRRAYRGMYRGGDGSLVSSDWVEANIHGHGALGDLYPNYRGGDIWSRTLGPVRGIKEGDTPSFLSLIPNGLSDPGRPWLGSWGGRFQGNGSGLTDIPDTTTGASSDPDPRMSSVYRHRAAFQNDFAARLDWCVEPPSTANHHPIVKIAGGSSRVVAAGDSISLDASCTIDPDGNALSFRWTVDPTDTETAGSVTIQDGETAKPRILVSPAPTAKLVSLLLTVSDDGRPSLTRYGRVLLEIKGSK
ncbi:MAG: DUF1593 domain-containing protein [Isosphaeraceae bacterium]|nr:DUF1593 domain-containing protein [Isosphaeraceae bacterium]